MQEDKNNMLHAVTGMSVVQKDKGKSDVPNFQHVQSVAIPIETHG